ncbi:hypothetical protein ACFRCI_03370 [Streptomyces sp. NPDC056638]|uniref:hypothetical protein n=1 Tax=Streptomyces sp. NPDC056638 TaxID=3345887 RepID=UPI0036B4DAD9
MSRLLPHPNAVLGYRKDGRPIHPILGASEGDPSAQPPSPTPPVRTFTQDEVSQLLAREKQQGARAGIGDVLSQLGFDKIDDLTAFVKIQKDAEAAQLTEVERREKAAVEKAAEAEQRIAVAAARERAAERRTTLVGLGALGADLVDAEALLRVAVADDADEQAVKDAAEALKKRRPGLFGGQGETIPAAPGGSPAGGPPPRRSTAPKPGAAGVDMAKRRGYISD